MAAALLHKRAECRGILYCNVINTTCININEQRKEK